MGCGHLYHRQDAGQVVLPQAVIAGAVYLQPGTTGRKLTQRKTN